MSSLYVRLATRSLRPGSMSQSSISTWTTTSTLTSTILHFHYVQMFNQHESNIDIGMMLCFIMVIFTNTAMSSGLVMRQGSSTI